MKKRYLNEEEARLLNRIIQRKYYYNNQQKCIDRAKKNNKIKKSLKKNCKVIITEKTIKLYDNHTRETIQFEW